MTIAAASLPDGVKRFAEPFDTIWSITPNDRRLT